jgi:signal transduction histidine kinase
VTVRVEDNGPGIPPRDLERIWTPDFTTKRRGSGIGLALVRQTVEAHGGRVSAGEGELGGAAFTVWLPLAPPLEGAGVDAGAAGTGGSE